MTEQNNQLADIFAKEMILSMQEISNAVVGGCISSKNQSIVDESSEIAEATVKYSEYVASGMSSGDAVSELSSHISYQAMDEGIPLLKLYVKP